MTLAIIIAAAIILILLASPASAREPTRRVVDPPDPVIDPGPDPLITSWGAAQSWPDADSQPIDNEDDFTPGGGDFGGGGASGSWDDDNS